MAKTQTWAILFRPHAHMRNPQGKLQKGLLPKGVTRARTEAGWLVFEGNEGEIAYTVPADVVAYAGDVAYEAELARSLADAPAQGSA